MQRLTIRSSFLLAILLLISNIAASPQPVSNTVSVQSAPVANISSHSNFIESEDGPEFPDCAVPPTIATCTNLQVFLLIDDSSSMLYTDPKSQRLEGVKNVLDILAKEYYLPAVEVNRNDPNVTLPNIQVSIIRFSSVVRHNSDWKTINPKNIDEWSIQLESFEADLGFKLDYNKPQATDFQTAFQAAVELADTNPQTSACPRLMMLFTDGVPNLGDGNLNDEDKNLPKNLTAYMDELRDIIQSQLNRNNDLLYITTFGSDSNFVSLWNRVYKQKWEEITQDSHRLDPRRVLFVPSQELALRMERIIGQTIGNPVYTLTPLAENPQQYITTIPAAVDKLRITYYTIDSSANFTVTEPDGKSHTSFDNDNQNSYIKVVEISNPAPGSYQITTTATGGVITQQLHFEKIVAELSTPMDNWLQFTNGEIGILLIGADGEPLPASEISIQAALRQPNQPDKDIESFTTSWMPTTTEVATVYACATLKDEQDEQEKPIILFHGVVGEIKIDAVTVQAGEYGKACVPTKNEVSVPLQLINKRTQQPISIDVPAELSSFLSPPYPGRQYLVSAIEEIDSKTGKYVLRFKPLHAGDLHFRVKAVGTIDSKPQIVFNDEIPPISIQPPGKLQLSTIEPATLSDRLSEFLYLSFHPVCIDKHTEIVIGQHLFGPTPVQINGRFVDSENNVSEPEDDQFSVQLVSPSGGLSSEILSKWTPSETRDDFRSLEFNSPGLGLYDIEITYPDDLECTELDSQPSIRRVLLINDFWEYLVILVLIIILTLLVIYLLRRYRNRRYGLEIPLILWSVVLIAVNILLVSMIYNQTFKCQLNCQNLIDDALGTDKLCKGISLPIRLPLGIPEFSIPILPRLNVIDPPLEILRQFIARFILVFIAMASLVAAVITSKTTGFIDRLRTPEGRKEILTYISIWLIIFVIFCILFYRKFV